MMNYFKRGLLKIQKIQNVKSNNRPCSLILKKAYYLLSRFCNGVNHKLVNKQLLSKAFFSDDLIT